MREIDVKQFLLDYTMNSSSCVRPISKMAHLRQQIQPLIASKNIDVKKRNTTQQLQRVFSSFNYYSNVRNAQCSKLTNISLNTGIKVGWCVGLSYQLKRLILT